MAPAAALAIEDEQPTKKTKRPEQPKGSKRTKGKQPEIKLEDFKKLSKEQMIIEIQTEIPKAKKPPMLDKLTEQQIVAYVAKRLGESDKPVKKQRRNKAAQSSLVTA